MKILGKIKIKVAKGKQPPESKEVETQAAV